MLVREFDYELPTELVAQEPAIPRDSARLLVLKRHSGEMEHRVFRDIDQFLMPGDCLVLNDTKVLPARLVGTRSKTGGKWEGLFVRESADAWEFMARTKGHPQPGETITLDREKTSLELIQKTESGTWLLRPQDWANKIARNSSSNITTNASAFEFLTRYGHVPIPPYIRHGNDAPTDSERYQTVFAAKLGAVAAPTAGLHFTEELLNRLSQKGVTSERVTLHVGYGTFQPIKVEDTDDHQMHSEWCELTSDTCDRLNAVRQAGGRVVAVGTTSVRTLESAFKANKRLLPFRGETKLFITPPYQFGAVDAMITNFHFPRTTLLMLVSAFAGKEAMLAAYKEAVAQRYRFFSYGDAMFIV